VQRTRVFKQADKQVEPQEAHAVEYANTVHNHFPVVCRHGKGRFDAGRNLRHEQKHLWQRVPEYVPPAGDGLEQQALLDVACLVVEDFFVRFDDVVPAGRGGVMFAEEKGKVVAEKGACDEVGQAGGESGEASECSSRWRRGATRIRARKIIYDMYAARTVFRSTR
jgi:hypothetical protein